MILTTWNCNMAFHRKHSAIAALNSDVAIISECANEARLNARGLAVPKDSYLWVGDNENKGLAVMVKPPYSVAPLFTPGETLPIWAMPVRITTPRGRYVDLIAVWSFWYRDKRNETGNPVVAALEQFSSEFDEENLIVAGDFNNSVIWDRGSKSSNHRLTSTSLAARGLTSVYHSQGGHEYGNEPHPTLYWRDRKIDGPRYHIDYVYAPKRWLETEVRIQVGSFDPWVQSKLSDHVPMTVNFTAIE
ncbi:MAG: endonuclease/exonuclease/phosphatase family protein [Candidatus Eremiobacteraeota bacterium]|nr:endonuclease/exonuclease/phosphatase family protein [Candidatus Eremiobacteraeota bacterium]